jgi:peptidoglycan-N-acetylmuramic acid deacetylase
MKIFDNRGDYVKTKMSSFVLIAILAAGSMGGIKAAPRNREIEASTVENKAAISFEEFDERPSIIKYLENVFTENEHNGFSAKEYSWYYKFRTSERPPETPMETQTFPSKYDCYGMGDTTKKELYLTFDEGYENGHTAPILDILKKHNVKAAFFVVKPYITTNPDLIKRMVDEGHLVCNHSARHPSMPSIKDQEKFNKEISDVEAVFEEITGKKMPKYFRPPMGKYSELSLHYTKEYGCKTVFWSLAHADWDAKKQPSPEAAKKKLLGRTYNGSIVLLHAVSKTNTLILEELITEWKKQGYEFKTLDGLGKGKEETKIE